METCPDQERPHGPNMSVRAIGSQIGGLIGCLCLLQFLAFFRVPVGASVAAGWRGCEGGNVVNRAGWLPRSGGGDLAGVIISSSPHPPDCLNNLYPHDNGRRELSASCP